MPRPLRAIFLAFLYILGVFSTAATAQTTVTYFHNDISGSPMVATDAAGNEVWKESYKPYGDKLRNAPASQNNTNKIGYAGSPFDASTGLSYMGARYYDPVIGRFMGIDPVGFQEENIHSFNRYAYANNNPYRYIDPEGRDSVSINFNYYMADTGLGFRAPLGHGGTLLINEKTGSTKYYEYGRYKPDSDGVIGAKLPENDGNVRKVSIPDATIGKDGKPTKDSLQKIYDSLSKSSGHGATVKATYYEGQNAQKIEQNILKIANDPNRIRYSLTSNTCKDFRDNTVQSGQ
jgi:RHS repeat-associated protein